MGRTKGSRNGERRLTFMTCQRCGRDFGRKPSDAVHSVYCSRACQNPPTYVTCDHCGHAIRVPPSRTQTRAVVGQIRSPQRFCSMACRHSDQAERNWSRYRDKIPHDKCVRCGSTRYVQVHHIDHNRRHGAVENLVAWCKSCHRLHHHRDDQSQPWPLLPGPKCSNCPNAARLGKTKCATCGRKASASARKSQLKT